MNGQADVEVDYKRKYKNLKRKLKFLVYVSNRMVSSFQWLDIDSLTNATCFLGAGMFSGGAAESTEKTAESLQRQKVRLSSLVLGRKMHANVGNNLFIPLVAFSWIVCCSMRELMKTHQVTLTKQV